MTPRQMVSNPNDCTHQDSKKLAGTLTFFSSNEYFILPKKDNPYVALAVDNAFIAKNSFKLFNPFSKKGIIAKKISYTAFKNVNAISKKVFFVTPKQDKSPFVSYLEKELDCILVTSIYFSPTNDKVVIQLQTTDAEVIGYLKYPISDEGLLHIGNEKKAIDILSDKGVISRYILSDEFDGVPFLLIANIEGDIGLPNRDDLEEILFKLKKDRSYLLENHPRICELKNSAFSAGLVEYSSLIERACQKSAMEYALVFENGDFAPWNIIYADGNCIPFDFEYFVEDGIEFFDLIKYYYSIGKLLERKRDKDLIFFISNHIEVAEFEIIFGLFLIKEVICNIEDNVPFEFEMLLLEVLNEI